MSTYDDEIDLRPYIQAIRKRWWLIALITGICAAAAFACSYFQERNYEAVATILITRSRASLSLSNQFPTISEPIDSRSRMEAMISISESEGMVVQTLDDIHQGYPENGIELEELKESVIITSGGDTIHIAATMNDPEYAAVIANTWANNAVQAINYAYTEEQLPSELQVSLDPARNEYDQAQTDLESFLQINQVDILQKQIDETSTLLDELVQDRTWKIAYNVRRKQKMEQVINQAEILNQLLDSRGASLAAGLGDVLAVMRLRADAFSEIQIDRGVSSSRSGGELLEGLTQETVILGPSQPDLVFDVQIAELIESIESGQDYQRDLQQIIQLAEQEKENAEAELLELAQQSLNAEENELFNATSSRLRNLQSQLESGQDYQRDLQQIIQLAEQEKENAEAELLELAQQSLNAEENELFNATSSRLRNLQSQLEAEQADLINKTSRRDLAFEIYQALIRKEAEVRNNLQTSSTVTLAGPAVPPVEPTSRGVVRNTAIGAAVGFFLSTIWVVGAVWLRRLDEPLEAIQESQ